jgi:hypothetical protein
MVLTKHFSLEHRPFNAFFLGMIYAVLGLLIGFTIFRAFAGIVAVFFTSIALMPSIHKLLAKAAVTEGRQKTVKSQGLEMTEFKVKGYKLTLKGMWEDHSTLIKVYFYSFFGVFLVFSAFTLFMPEKYSVELFEGQTVKGSATGQSINGFEDCTSRECIFRGYIVNNLWVLAVCFLIALIYGYGATFIVTWNAAVWGHAFATQAIFGASIAGTSPAIYFAFLLLAVFPHTTTEAMAYFTGAISGGIVSYTLGKEGISSTRFFQVLWQSLIVLAIAILLVFFAAYLETYAIDFFKGIFLT